MPWCRQSNAVQRSDAINLFASSAFAGALRFPIASLLQEGEPGLEAALDPENVAS
jgi:hypothetical protein